MQYTTFNRRLGAQSGILQLMDDLGRAMSGQDRMLMLGGGNPAHIPGLQAVWRRRMAEIMADGDAFERMLTNYGTPKGDAGFIEAFVRFLNRNFGLGVRVENVAVTNSGQFALFCLINMLAGPRPDGSNGRLLFPLMPEYIGYADQCLTTDAYRTCRPRLELRPNHAFKYRIDFERLDLDGVAAIVLSRPTNPTGNVVTDAELQRLDELARERDIPLIVDNAYGQPFPGIVFADARLTWSPGMILSFSLSKLGLPGTRTGIVVAPEAVIRSLVAMNSVVSLASGNVGQALVGPLLESNEVMTLSREVVRPFYAQKLRLALGWVDEAFGDDLDYRVHCCEGALFLWFWFRGLPISDLELYERLKRRGVLVVPGSHFFFASDEPWAHRHECLRINYTQAEETVRPGLRILAEEVKRAYRDVL